jgi:Na+-transporting methylmalonyl-CoA/oxaloacetate decarboxylase gamma subunit
MTQVYSSPHKTFEGATNGLVLCVLCFVVVVVACVSGVQLSAQNTTFPRPEAQTHLATAPQEDEWTDSSQELTNSHPGGLVTVRPARASTDQAGSSNASHMPQGQARTSCQQLSTQNTTVFTTSTHPTTST